MEPPDLSFPVRSEADVETRIVFPILNQLGWSLGEIHPKVPVTFKSGTKQGRPFEADFVLAPQEPRPPKVGFVVVEAKSPDASLDDAADQALSYAVVLRAALYCTCNGQRIQVWRFSWAAPSQLVFDSVIADLTVRWGEIELELSRASVLAFYDRLAPQRVEIGNVDVAAYVQALHHTMASSRLCDRTARTPDDDTIVISSTGTSLPFAEGKCTVISGLGGRGKSSLLALLAHAQTRQLIAAGDRRVPITLRASDVGEGGVVQSIVNELEGLIPSFATSAAVQAWMRAAPTLVLFDDWERASNDARTAVKRFIRDMANSPCATVVAARDGVVVPSEARGLRLEALSEQEQRQFVVALRPDIEWDEYRLNSLIKNPPYSLQTLLREPVVLAEFLRLTTWSAGRGMEYPRDLPHLLDQVLGESVARNHSDRRARTDELIAVCCELSRMSSRFDLRALQTPVRDLAATWTTTELIGELLDLGVISPQRSLYEFSHDLWRLHFLTKDRVGRIMTRPEVVAWIDELEPDLELALPFVASLLTEADLQDEMFRQLGRRGFSLYCTALRTRATTTEAQTGKELRLLASISDSYVSLVDQFCPRLKPFIDPWKGLGAAAPLDNLLIAGVFAERSLSLCFGALPVADRRREVTLAPSFESFMNAVEANAADGYYQTHSVALAHYGIRIDSGHAIAMERLVSETREAIMSDGFVEAEWLLREECWTRVESLVSERHGTTGLTVADFEAWLQTNAKKVGARFVEDVVPILHRLRAFDLDRTPIDDIPLPQPDLQQRGDPRTAYTLERRQQRTTALFNAVVKTYREICESYLPGFLSELKYASFPMRPRVSIMRVLSEYEWDAWYWWEPVGTWDEAGAIVDVVNDRTETKSREEVRALLAQESAALDRRTSSLGLAMGELGGWGRTDKDVTEMVKRLVGDDLSRIKRMGSGIQ